MKVSELIEMLKQFNPDTIVEIQYMNSCADYGLTKASANIGRIELEQATRWCPDTVTIITDEWDGK